MSNCLKRNTLQVELSGTSLKSKEDAVSQAFQNMQKEVNKKEKGIVISIRPLSVEVKELEVNEYTEKFLFLFMPRKKQKVKITLSINVEIDVLKIEEGETL